VHLETNSGAVLYNEKPTRGICIVALPFLPPLIGSSGDGSNDGVIDDRILPDLIADVVAGLLLPLRAALKAEISTVSASIVCAETMDGAPKRPAAEITASRRVGSCRAFAPWHKTSNMTTMPCTLLRRGRRFIV